MHSVWIDDICVLSCRDLSRAMTEAKSARLFYDWNGKTYRVFVMPA